jgi:PAS domain-containing protein
VLNVGLLAVGDLPTAIKAYGSEVGFAQIDYDKRYLSINTALARQNGRPAEEHIGRTVREVIPQAAAQVEALLDECRRTRQPVVDVPLIWTAANGEEREGFLTYRPDFTADGAFLGWTALVRTLRDANPFDKHLDELRRIESDVARLRKKGAEGGAEAVHAPNATRSGHP